MLDLPCRSMCNFVQVLPALVAEILFWDHGVIQDTHAATVLPNIARVALDEQTAWLWLIRQQLCIARACHFFIFGAVHFQIPSHGGLPVAGWEARVVLLTADAASGLLAAIVIFVVFHVDVIEALVVLFVAAVTSFPRSCLGHGGSGLVGFFGRRRAKGALGRSDAVGGTSAPFDSTR